MVVPPLSIKKPSTSEDNGTPSKSCVADIKRVFRFIEDERHLIANGLYQDVLNRIRNGPALPTSRNKLRLRKSKSFKDREGQNKDIQEAEAIIASKKEVLENLNRRCRLFAKARQNLLDDDHWTLAQTLFGVTTYYRNEKNGSLSIKMEGKLEGVSLFDQVAVLREVDLHYKWAPFCSSSMTIAHLDKLDTVGWFVVGLPSFGLMRDACFRAIGCDSMLEDGSILLVAQGINDQIKAKPAKLENISPEEAEELKEFDYLSKDPILNTLDLPDPPTRIGSGRMTIRTFQSLIQVESPTSARTHIIANVDPNLPFVPHSLLDFIMKKLCGVLLNKLQHAAKRVAKDPINNAHASKMRQEELFYMHWLMPKFEAVCKLRNWAMPKAASFDLSDQQMELAQEADKTKIKDKNPKSLRFYHSLDDDGLGEYFDDDAGRLSAPARIGGRVAKSRSMTEDSVLSDISRNSSSVTIWQNNPISSYLRELEEKTQLKKANEIRRSREKAAHRLKPKPLDDDAKSRLEELRQARHRRETGSLSVTHQSENAERPSTELSKASQRKDVATLLARHGVMPRLFVMTTLVASFFIFLSLRPWIEDYIAERIAPFNTVYGRDIAAVFHMSVSGSLHFAMSYVSLMYAFSALHIGSVAGREALRFYSQNIHLILGTFSSSLVILGLLRASVTSMLRWLICKSAVLASFLTEQLGRTWVDDALPDRAISIMKVLSGLTDVGFRFAVTTSKVVLRWLFAGMIDSNFVGRSFWRILYSLVYPFRSGWSRTLLFVHNSLEAHDGRVDLPTWREDACATTRILLSYSGIFLLVTVLLFIMFARSGRSHAAKHTNLDSRESDSVLDKENASDDVPPLYPTSTSSRDSALPVSWTRSGSLSQAFETIHEEPEEGFEDSFQDYDSAERYIPTGHRRPKQFGIKKLVRRLGSGDPKSVKNKQATTAAASI